MKNIVAFFVFFLSQYPCFPQSGLKTYKVSGDITLVQLTDHIFVHVSYSDIPGFGRVASNGMIYTNGNQAFLFDTPTTDSLTQTLYTWLTDSMKLQIIGFVPNHWHSDCMGGLAFLKHQKIKSYANQLTIDIAKARNLPVPDHGFTDSLHVQLGDKPIECYYLGAAHTTDNIVVWIPAERVLFAGCMVKSIGSSTLGNIADGDLTAYPATIGKVLARFPTAQVVIPGHGQVGGLELVTHTRELLLNTGR